MGVLNSGVTHFYRSIYSIVEHVRERGLVIYGAGYWGRISVQIFSLFQVGPALFCDDDPAKQGLELDCGGTAVPVVSLDEAAERMPEAVYFAAVTSGGGIHAPRAVMNRRLRERGLLGEDAGFHPLRYLFLLEGGMQALERPLPPGEDQFSDRHIKNMVVFNHMSNSGDIFFGTLMDGHPDILNIPIFGDLVPFQDVYEARLQYLEGTELVLETASQLTPYFASRFPESAYEKTIHRLASRFYLNQSGDPEERVYIPADRFVSALGGLLEGRGRVSFATLLKAVYAAYHNAAGRTRAAGQGSWLFYMRHKVNYDLHELDALLSPEDFQRVEYWFIIREPVQHWFSWLKRNVVEEKPENLWYPGRPAEYADRLCCDLGLMLEKKEGDGDKTVRVVRFEDVKAKTRGTMEAVCRCLDVPFDPCMLESTTNGIPVYFPSSGGSRQVIGTNDRTALDRRDFSALLSSYDIFRLNLVFQDFKRAYGYDCDMPDYREFSQPFLEELFRRPFRFEPVLDKAGKAAEAGGFLAPGESPACHGHITGLFLRYCCGNPRKLYEFMIVPDANSDFKGTQR